MAHAIDRYLGREITAFQFDEAIDELAWRTEDETVKDVMLALWYFYDDITDHWARLTKPEWDLYYRLNLFLRSGNEMRETTRRLTVREEAMWPFSSITDIYAARKRVPDFAKVAYQPELAYGLAIGSPLSIWIAILAAALGLAAGFLSTV